MAEWFPQFASRLIRNSATLGGNLGTASPIGDSPPTLLALDASLILASRAGEREVPLADFFRGYRQTESARRRADPRGQGSAAAGPPHAVSTSTPSAVSTIFPAWRWDCPGARRRPRAAASASAWEGWPPPRIRALKTEEALTGRPWTERTVREAAQLMGQEGTPLSRSPCQRRVPYGHAGTGAPEVLPRKRTWSVASRGWSGFPVPAPSRSPSPEVTP